MLKKTVTYEDFDGNTVSETLYFNLTEAELVELEVSATDGFAENLQAIVASNNRQLILDSFKKIIMMAYGVRSEDGKRFIKTDQVKEEFMQTAAYSAVFVELTSSATAGAEFVNGVIPQSLAAKLAAQGTQLPLPATDEVELPEARLPETEQEVQELRELVEKLEAEDGVVEPLKTKAELEAMSQPELIAYFESRQGG